MCGAAYLMLRIAKLFLFGEPWQVILFQMCFMLATSFQNNLHLPFPLLAINCGKEKNIKVLSRDEDRLFESQKKGGKPVLGMSNSTSGYLLFQMLGAIFCHAKLLGVSVFYEVRVWS